MDGQPNNAAPVASVKPQKVGLNPFKHLSTGVKNLAETNLGVSLAIIAIQFIATMGTGFLAVFLTVNSITDLRFDNPGTGIATLIGKIIVITLVSAVVLSTITMALTRSIMLGSRKEKADLGDTFKIAFQRLPLAILFLLAIGGIYFAGVAAIALSAAITPILAIVLGIAGFIAVLIYIFRLIYVEFLIVEDEKPAGIFPMIKQSTALWSKSGGAVIVYGLTVLVIYLVLSAVFLRGSGSITYTNTNTTSSNYTYNSAMNEEEYRNNLANDIKKQTTDTYNVGSQAISSLLSALISMIVLAGMANIYNDARELTGDAQLTTPAAPVAPVGPTPQASTSAATSFAPTPPEENSETKT